MTIEAIVDSRGEPVRCEDCGCMFTKLPKVWGERGPHCQRCRRIDQGLIAAGVKAWMGRETYGDRRHVLEEE